MWALLIASSVGSAVVAGVLFAFSTSVMTALSRQPAGAAILTMQEINRVIQNPWFLMSFMGTALACAAVVVLTLLTPDAPGALLRLTGASAYLIGVFGITVAINVPLNNRLDAQDAATPEAARFWAGYLSRWTRWNHVRTCAGVLAAALLTMGVARVAP